MTALCSLEKKTGKISLLAWLSFSLQVFRERTCALVYLSFICCLFLPDKNKRYSTDIDGKSICISFSISCVIPIPIKMPFPVPLCPDFSQLWVTEIYWDFLQELQQVTNTLWNVYGESIFSLAVFLSVHLAFFLHFTARCSKEHSLKLLPVF